MPTHTVGLVAFGRICRALSDSLEPDPDFEVAFVLVRGAVEDLPPEIQTTDPAVLRERAVDLVVEGATPEAVAELGEAAIEGVTGDETLVSIRGSIGRVLGAEEGLQFV